MPIIKVRDAVIDPLAKMALTELQDSFGAPLIVQTPILSGDHNADVAAATTLMQANEDAFVAKLQTEFQHTDEQIAALQVNAVEAVPVAATPQAVK